MLGREQAEEAWRGRKVQGPSSHLQALSGALRRHGVPHTLLHPTSDSLAMVDIALHDADGGPVALQV